VFELGLESNFKTFVPLHQREAFTPLSWIIHSGSKYALFLTMQITDSCMLNVTAKESLASQNSIWL